MAKTYRTALIITGDAKGGVQAIRATERELDKLDKHQRRTIATNKKMAKAASGMRVAALGAAGGLAGMAAAMAGGQLLQYTNQAISTTAELGNMADATGVSAERLQELDFALRQFNSNADLSDVTEALATISDRAQDALSGTTSFIQDFALIGVSVDELRNKNPVELLKLFAESLENTRDSTTRMTAAVRTFGDDLGVKLLPLLAQGADGIDELAQQAHEAGAVLSNDLVDAAQEVDKEFKQLTQTISVWFKRGVLNVVQGAQQMANALDDAFNISEQPVEERLSKVVTQLDFMRSQLPKSPFKEELSDEIERYEAMAAQFREQIRESGMNARAQAVIDARNDSIVDDLLNGGDGDKGGGDLSGQAIAAARLREQYTDLTASMAQQITLFGKTSDVAELRYRLELGDLAALSDAKKQHLLGMAKELQTLRDQKAAAESLFPALQKLKDLKNRAEYVDSLGGNLGNLARKQMGVQLGNVATQGAPAMQGLDAVVGGPFSEMTRLEQQRREYEMWYQQRLAMLREFQNEKYGVMAQANAAIEQLNSEHQTRTAAYERQSMSARLAGVSEVLGNITDITGQFVGEQSGLYKALFVANKAASIAQAIINTETAATKALTLGPILGVPASTLIRATGYASIGLMAATSIGSLAGQAHDGIDNVPNSGTWNLEKGERIVDRRTNADLKEYLMRANAPAGSSNRVNITVPVTVQAQPGMSQQEADRQGRQIGDGVANVVRRVLVDEKRPGGLLAEAS